MGKIKLLLSLVFFLQSYSCIATILTFVDQNGERLSDVVVTVPGDVSDAPADNAPAVMDQVDKQFRPHVLVIRKGQQVSFPNSDDIRHHVYSFSDAKAFEIKLYSGDTVPPVSFDKPGVVVLGCNIHDSMVGYIYVHDNQRVWLTDATGRISVPDDIVTAEVWHPHLNVVKTHTQQVTLNDTGEDQTIRLKLQAVPRQSDTSRTFGKRTFGG